MSDQPALKLTRRELDGIAFHLVETGVDALVECRVQGIETKHGRREVINSVVGSNKAKALRDWKLEVAETIRKSRRFETGPIPAVLSIAFLMCSENHGNREYDIENFVKPVIDGIAMGLWGDLDAVRNDSSVRFDADDSVFRSLYFEDCPVESPNAEGVYIAVFPLDGGNVTASEEAKDAKS